MTETSVRVEPWFSQEDAVLHAALVRIIRNAEWYELKLMVEHADMGGGPPIYQEIADAVQTFLNSMGYE